MQHQCRDCSYRGKRLVQGGCPACGSANIGRLKGVDKEAKPTSNLSTVVMLALWVALAYLLFDKFF